MLIYVIIFLAGISALYLYQHKTYDAPLEYYVGQETTVTGKIKKIKQSDEKFIFIIETQDDEKIMCTYYGELENYRDLFLKNVQFHTTIERPKSSGNPRVFNYELYLKSQGISYVCSPKNIFFPDVPINYYDRFYRWIFLAREDFIEKLDLSDDIQGLIKGVIFGDSEELDEKTYEEFRKNSTAHVLAVSGLHIGVLFSIYKLLKKKRNSIIITIAYVLFTLIYGFATLWSVSVTRAVFLTYIMIFGNYIDRRYDLITSAALVAAFFAVRNPYVIFGAGFQMSFLAVASIAFLTPVFEKYLPADLAGAAAVQIGMMPYMIYNFNGISFIGIIINIPVVYVISSIVPVGVLGYILYLAAGCIVPTLPLMLSFLSKLTVSINHFFSEASIFYISVPSMSLGTLFLIYGIMFVCSSEYFQVQIERKKWISAAGCMSIVMVTAFTGWWMDSTPFDKADLVFIDVGQGDAVHLKAEKNRNILVDGGGNINYNIGTKVLMPYFLKNGIGKIDLAMATHLHSDHYLGIEQLVESFNVTSLITEGKSGEEIILGENGRIEILWPEDEIQDTDDENLSCMIYKITFKNMSVLITGDITEEGEEMLLRKYAGTGKLEADVLKVAHHGSPYSSSDKFIEAVNPRIAVISVGKNNYGHPSQLVIEKLQKKGIIVFRTDLDGAVGIRKNGDDFLVCTKRNRKNMLSRPLQKT